MKEHFFLKIKQKLQKKHVEIPKVNGNENMLNNETEYKNQQKLKLLNKEKETMKLF